jgi:pimeloyl-ACP methyl ester esterase
MIKQTVYECVAAQPLMGIPLVLINGWGVGEGSWQSLLPALQTYSRVIVINVTYESDADSLCEKIHQILPEQSVLIGWSLGGMLATKIAASYPQSVSALVTLACNAQFVANATWQEAMEAATFTAFYQALQNNPAKTLTRFLSLVVLGDEQQREQKRYLNTVDTLADRKDLLSGLDLLRDINNQQAIAQLTCPSLHLFGENDQLVPVAAVNKIQRLNPQYQCEIIQDASHLLHLPAERVLTVMAPFFNGFLKANR